MTEPESASPAEPWPGLLHALLLTLLAVSGRLFTALMLGQALGFRESVLGMSAIVGFGVALALAAPNLRVPAPQAFALVPPRPLAWLAVPLLAPWLLLVSELDNAIAQTFPSGDPAAAGGAELPLDGSLALFELALAIGVAIPVAQELFFRGLLQTALVPRLGRLRGVLLVCALDGLALLPLFGPRAAAFGVAQALALGVLREGAGSLQPALALHVAFGAIGVLARIGAFGIPGFDDTSVSHTPVGWLLAAGASCACAFFVCAAAARRSR